MCVLDAVRPGLSKVLYGAHGCKTATLHKVANDEKACTVEAVMAMDTNYDIVPALSSLLVGSDFVNEFNEPLDLRIRWGHL